MGVVRDQLVFKALCALDEVVEQARVAQVKPTFAVRFALAYLYAVSDGRRDPFDSFWREIQEPHDKEPGGMGHYIRGTSAQASLCGIVRGVGLYLNVELDQALSHARQPKAKRHAAEEAQRRRLAHIEEIRDGTAYRRQQEAVRAEAEALRSLERGPPAAPPRPDDEQPGPKP